MVQVDFSRNRYEVKYMVPISLLPQLRAQLAGILINDKNTQETEGNYINQSIYFDNRSLKNYFDKCEGLNERLKVRLRLYRKNLSSTPDGYFLEFKHRIGRIVSKSRTRVDQKLAQRIVRESQCFEEIDPHEHHQCLKWFHYLVRRDLIKPVLTTLYKREAYHTVFYRDVRLTIDTDIRASSQTSLKLNPRSFRNVIDPRYSIVELKYCGKVPRLIVNRIAKLCLTQVTFSKYGRGLEGLYNVMAVHGSEGEFSSLER